MRLLGQFVLIAVVVSIMWSIIIFFDKRMMAALAKEKQNQSQNEQKK